MQLAAGSRFARDLVLLRSEGVRPGDYAQGAGAKGATVRRVGDGGDELDSVSHS